MVNSITTLQDALAYQLELLVWAERKIGKEFKACSEIITSAEVKSIVDKYIENAENINLKLDRIFSYLMREPAAAKNEVINKMIDETKRRLKISNLPQLKDVLMIGCLKTINAYKIASYQTCHLIAGELELDEGVDLIQQILNWEVSIANSLNTISIREFNKINNLS